jgi:hypothetical protein
VIVGDLNTPLSSIDRSSRQKINKQTSEVCHTLDHIDMVDIYKVFHPTTRQYILFWSSWNFSKINHILGHKTSLNKLKKTEITPCIISDHNRIKLDLNNKRNPRKYSNTWRLNNTLLKNQWVTEVINKEIKKFLEPNENENATYQNLWDTAQVVLRGKFIAISAYTKKNRDPSNNLMMHLKLIEKQEQTKPKISRQKW